MSYPIESRQSDNVTAPRAGLITALAASTTAANVNLSVIGKVVVSSQNSRGSGCQDKFVWCQADGGDIYIVCGATQASVATTNAPLPTAVGSNVTQGCVKIPNGTAFSFRPVGGVDVWLAYVTATGTATLRIWEGSP